MKFGQKLKQFLLDPVLIIGAVLSLAVSLTLHQNGAEGTSSLLVGLLLFVVTLQVQIILTDKYRLNRETLYGKTVAVYESTSWLADELSALLTHARDATEQFQRTPEAMGRIVFRRLVEEMRQLKGGQLQFPYLDKDIVIELTGAAQKTITAITFEKSTPEFWLSSKGRQFVKAQEKAVARGVDVRRVFAYAEWSPQLDAVARNQLAAGFKIRRVLREEIPAELRNNMVLFDGACAYALRVEGTNQPTGYLFTVDVARFLRDFDAVWNIAEELPASAVKAVSSQAPE